MRRLVTIFALSGIIFGGVAPVQPSSIEFTEAFVEHQIRWPVKTIKVSLSTSLSSPGPNMKPGSDVIGAAHRALAGWSSMTGIKFVTVSSRAQSISPTADGNSLITIADTVENRDVFVSGDNNGRTRVFYNQTTGEISEADIVINPHPVSADGTAVQFSTDGTLGTYDLESTLTHEIGHLLGLEHSGIVAATMQARQALNGVYDIPAYTSRTLSEDDRAAVRRVYGPHRGLGAIEGKILTSSAGTVTAPAHAAYVWAEEFTTGRVISSSLTSSSGNYRIESLSPGQYRVVAAYLDGPIISKEATPSVGYSGVGSPPGFWTSELTNQTGVAADVTTTVNAILVLPQNNAPWLKPRLMGLNGQLSTTALPVEAGKKYTIYVGGEGVDQVPGSGITVTSPFMKIDPASLRLEQFGTALPVISFELTVAVNARFGDYSIRLQSNSGQTAYLAGGITVDPGVNSAVASPADDPYFFVRQHYQDFLGRQAEKEGLEYWSGQISQCGPDRACIRSRRSRVSTAFFMGREFQETGFFVCQFYQTSLGRRPSFVEFSTDRDRVRAGPNVDAAKLAFALSFVRRPEFLEQYPLAMGPDHFVDALLDSVSRNSTVDLSSQRKALIKLYDRTDAGREAILRLIAENPSLVRAEYNRAFVLMQYFGYLRRDPDQADYNFWVNVLSGSSPSEPASYQAMVCAFISSAEYQNRFGMLATHTNEECSP
jgi:matrixin/uncharacterized protein DUF4214